jgi:hypothetical protein
VVLVAGIGAVGDCKALELARFRVAFADRHRDGFGQHVGLGFKAQDRDRGALGVVIERAEAHPVDEALVLANVELEARLGRLRGGQRQAHRLVGRAHVARHLDVRDVQRLAGLVEPPHDAVFGQRILQVQPRRRQQIAQGVFVFVAVQPPQDRTAARGGVAALEGDDRLGDGGEKGRFLTSDRACRPPAAASRRRARGRGCAPSARDC